MESRNTSGGDGGVPVSTSQAGLPGSGSLPMRAGHLPMREVVNLYLSAYTGKDSSRIQRLTWWIGRIGSLPLQDLTDDHIHAALEELSQQPSKFFAGRDADGKPILKARRKPVSGATLNRYQNAIGAVCTWAVRRRIAPRGWFHPCRALERRPEAPGKTRFLSDEERTRLLDACRASSWDRLYGLVLFALTSGARRSELLGLRWANVDLERGIATLPTSKNGDQATLIVLPAVADELRKFAGAPGALVFPSPRDPRVPFTFDDRWREALRVARIKGFRFHDLRHSCASAMAAAGRSLLEVGDVLRHRQASMVRRYAHLSTEHRAKVLARVFGDVK